MTDDLTPDELRAIQHEGAFARTCMMQEAIASCAIEGVTVDAETEARLIAEAAKGEDL